MEKSFSRGESKAVYTQDAMVAVWKDNKPVYMASNVDCLEPLSSCPMYSKKDKKYLDVPQPDINVRYNKAMGGVDLVDNAEKNYAITTRTKEWYWSLFAWFLNITMVQAWCLYRAHKNHEFQLVQEREKEELGAWAQLMEDSFAYTKVEITAMKKERQKEFKKRRNEEKKYTEIPLLEFTRQVVEITVSKHSKPKELIITQREATEKLGPVAAAKITGTG